MTSFEIARLVCAVLFSATLGLGILTLVLWCLRSKRYARAARIAERMALACAIAATVPATVLLASEADVYFNGHVFARAALTNRALSHPGFLASTCAPMLLWLPQARRHAVTVIPFLGVWLIYNWPF